MLQKNATINGWIIAPQGTFVAIVIGTQYIVVYVYGNYVTTVYVCQIEPLEGTAPRPYGTKIFFTQNSNTRTALCSLSHKVPYPIMSPLIQRSQQSAVI